MLVTDTPGGMSKAALVMSGGLVSDRVIRGVTSIYQIAALRSTFRRVFVRVDLLPLVSQENPALFAKNPS